MKLVITGHTHGLGLAIFKHFKDSHEVVGLSRSTGFDLNLNLDQVAEIAKSCDVFFNNAHVGVRQAELIKKLHGHVRIVTSGSMAAAKVTKPTEYDIAKKFIESTHVSCKRVTSTPMLLLRMGYLENYPDKNPIKYDEVLSAIDFWLLNQRVSIIEFENVGINT